MAGEHDVKDIADLRPGDHLCSIYNDEEEHRALLTPYLRYGLEKNEKVLYIVDAHTAEEILGYLEEEGMDTRPYLDSGQLAVLTVDDAYIKGGVFDPDGMIRLLTGETELAISRGYAALRVTGEMTWALKGLPGSERLIEYEAKLNHFFPGSACLSICQYDRRRFGPEVLLDVLATHPIAVVGIDIYDYIPPHEYLGNKLPESTLDHWIANLSARKRVEQALEIINRELEAYAQVVSHDLRAPISVIEGASSTLDELMEGCRDHEVADQAREIVEIIKKSSRNAEALIGSLLSLAEAGQVPTRITEVDVKRTVETIFEEKSAIIEEKGAKVVIVEDLGLVMAEPTHIYQLFSNLIGNALRYNDNPEPEVRISYYWEEEGGHRYLVSDNGPGIRTEDLERIFDPLFKGKGGGTGIGLSIARKIAGIYGGGIKAYNDGGACFEFTIKDFRQEK